MIISKKWELLLRHRDGQHFKTRRGVVYSAFNGNIEVEHPNGYTGCYYGRHSMSIYKDGKEVMHSGSCYGKRSPDELYKRLEGMPEFFKVMFEEEQNDDT